MLLVGVRVYTEDPKRFLPSIGPLLTSKEPKTFATSDKVLWIDTGVYEGGVIYVLRSYRCVCVAARRTVIEEKSFLTFSAVEC